MAFLAPLLGEGAAAAAPAAAEGAAASAGTASLFPGLATPALPGGAVAAGAGTELAAPSILGGGDGTVGPTASLATPSLSAASGNPMLNAINAVMNHPAMKIRGALSVLDSMGNAPPPEPLNQGGGQTTVYPRKKKLF